MLLPSHFTSKNIQRMYIKIYEKIIDDDDDKSNKVLR